MQIGSDTIQMAYTRLGQLMPISGYAWTVAAAEMAEQRQVWHFAYYADGHRNLLYRSGRLLGNLESAFLAEALALEWGLDMFASIMA